MEIETPSGYNYLKGRRVMRIRITLLRILILCTVILATATYISWDWLWTTDTYRVKMTVEAIARGIEQNDYDAWTVYLDDRCRIAGREVEDFRKFYDAAMKIVPVKEAHPFDIVVTFDADNCNLATAKVQSEVILRDRTGQYRIDWKLKFRRHGEYDWKMTDAIPYWPRSREQIFITQIEWLLR